MQTHKYWDWNREKGLGKNNGAPFSGWMAEPNHPSSFAVHPEEFLIFLRLLDSVARPLKPNGHLIVSTPSRYHLNNLFHVLAGKPVALASPHHETEYSVGQVLEQLRYAGFGVQRMACKVLWPERITVRGRTKLGIGALLTGFIRLNRSHHNLVSTVFYLGRKCKIK